MREISYFDLHTCRQVHGLFHQWTGGENPKAIVESRDGSINVIPHEQVAFCDTADFLVVADGAPNQLDMWMGLAEVS